MLPMISLIWVELSIRIGQIENSQEMKIPTKNLNNKLHTFIWFQVVLYNANNFQIYVFDP